MTEDTNQITADNLRADFLNATTNWQRWKVLNRALQWALDASELNDWYRQNGTSRAAAAAAATPGVAVGDRALCVGDIVTWDGDVDGWIVRAVGPGSLVTVAPLADDWALGEHQVSAEILLDAQGSDFET